MGSMNVMFTTLGDHLLLSTYNKSCYNFLSRNKLVFFWPYLVRTYGTVLVVVGFEKVIFTYVSYLFAIFCVLC